MIEETLLNPAWRLENLYYIVDKNAKRTLFKPNAIQRRLNQSTSKRKKILKARQVGISTNELIKQLDHTLWNENVNAAILAHEQDSIEKLFNMVRRAYEFIDPQFKPQLDRGGGSKYEMRFPATNSKIYCDLESRGDTIHWLHISEAAFADPERIRATLQAVPISGRVTIETTPNGIGNHFYESWIDESDGYSRHFFPWYLMPEYRIIDSRPFEFTDEERQLIQSARETYGIELTHEQIAFRRLKKAELKNLFIQEYPENSQSCFLASGGAAMDAHILKALLEKAPKPIEETNSLKIYEEPHADGIYVVGADVAEGDGGDYSVACVIESRSMRQVAVLRGHFKPRAFAERLVELCERYKIRSVAPILAVERNNHGHAVIQELHEHLYYPNLYRARDEKLGWHTNSATRPLLIDTFITAVECKHLTLLDRTTILECMSLVEDSGKIQSAGGKHDDIVIATAIALQMAQHEAQSQWLYANIKSRILMA